MITRFLQIALAGFMTLVWLAAPYTVKAQEDEEKAIKAEVFIKERPPSTNRNRATGRYKSGLKSGANVNGNPPPGTTFVQVGVTFWRFRPSTAADKTKELVEEDSAPSEWTLERIEEGTPLLPGQRVRLSIESLTRSGYLYVIDREQYEDGSTGDPILIYPTQRTRDDNYVRAGRLVYIPSATGKFRIKPSDGPKRHVGELLTILIAAQPLIDAAELSSKAIKLPRETLLAWEKQWMAKPTKFELDGGAGQAMTEREQAVRGSSSELTQNDPVPQTVYRVAIRPSDSVLLSVPMKFSPVKR